MDNRTGILRGSQQWYRICRNLFGHVACLTVLGGWTLCQRRLLDKSILQSHRLTHNSRGSQAPGPNGTYLKLMFEAVPPQAAEVPFLRGLRPTGRPPQLPSLNPEPLWVGRPHPSANHSALSLKAAEGNLRHFPLAHPSWYTEWVPVVQARFNRLEPGWDVKALNTSACQTVGNCKIDSP